MIHKDKVFIFKVHAPVGATLRKGLAHAKLTSRRE